MEDANLDWRFKGREVISRRDKESMTRYIFDKEYSPLLMKLILETKHLIVKDTEKDVVIVSRKMEFKEFKALKEKLGIDE